MLRDGFRGLVLLGCRKKTGSQPRRNLALDALVQWMPLIMGIKTTNAYQDHPKIQRVSWLDYPALLRDLYWTTIGWSSAHQTYTQTHRTFWGREFHLFFPGVALKGGCPKAAHLCTFVSFSPGFNGVFPRTIVLLKHVRLQHPVVPLFTVFTNRGPDRLGRARDCEQQQSHVRRSGHARECGACPGSEDLDGIVRTPRRVARSPCAPRSGVLRRGE